MQLENLLIDKNAGRKCIYSTEEERKRAKQEQTNKSCLKHYYKIQNIDPDIAKQKRKQKMQETAVKNIFMFVEKLNSENKIKLVEFLLTCIENK